MNRCGKRTGYRLAGFLLPLFFFFSCATYDYTRLEVLKAPPTNVPFAGKKVVLLYENYVLPLEKINENRAEKLQQDEASKLIAEYYFNALKSEMTRVPFADEPEFMVTSWQKEKGSHADIIQVPEIVISKVAKDHEADMIIALEYVKIKDSVEVSYSADDYAYVVRQWVYNSSLWRIYTPGEWELQDEYLNKDTLTWSAIHPDPSVAFDQLPERQDAYRMSCEKAVQSYGQRLLPQWEPQQRFYYQDVNFDFIRAAGLVRREQWQKAVNIWSDYIEDDDDEKAGKACYNIALAFEFRDKLVVALDWAKIAYELYPDDKIKTYKKLLEKRIIQKYTLNSYLIP